MQAAIDVGVPAHVLSAALYSRFDSRGRGDFADKVLSAMRLGFGGHVEQAAERRLPTGAAMERRDCDALVLFGASGDLCYRKIYPALYQLVRRGLLTVPVIGVARQGWKLEQLAARVRDSIEAFVPGADEAVSARLVGLLRYVDGDYNARATFDALRQALGPRSGRCTTWRSRRACSRWSPST